MRLEKAPLDRPGEPYSSGRDVRFLSDVSIPSRGPKKVAEAAVAVNRYTFE